MTAVMSYSSLVSQLQTWMERVGDTAYVSEIPTIISQSESMLSREYKGLGTQLSVSGNFQAGVSVIDKPARWRETVYFGYGQGATVAVAGQKRVEMFNRPYDYCRSYWPNPTTTSSTLPPRYYSDYEFGHFLVVPTPIVAYPFELVFYQRPQPLDSTNSTNWLTENAPDLMFKACVLWASRYLRGDLSDKYQADYDRALASAMGEDYRRKGDAGEDARKGT